LCDDDYEFLGVADPMLQSSWEHCRDIALAAEAGGYDNLLLPSGYTLGIDSVSFAAAIAPLLRRMQLLLAVRMGEMWPPQLVRQLATIDQILQGRLTVNIISSQLPGETLDSEARYRRTLEFMQVLRDLLDGRPSTSTATTLSSRSTRRASSPPTAARRCTSAASRRTPARWRRRPRTSS
jgi:alkanesulfonate monooxygenase